MCGHLNYLQKLGETSSSPGSLPERLIATGGSSSLGDPGPGLAQHRGRLMPALGPISLLIAPHWYPKSLPLFLWPRISRLSAKTASVGIAGHGSAALTPFWRRALRHSHLKKDGKVLYSLLLLCGGSVTCLETFIPGCKLSETLLIRSKGQI